MTKGILWNSLFGDSTVLKFTIENTSRFIDSVEKLSKRGSKARKQKFKSSVPDSLVEHNLLSIIDLWAQATQQFIGAYKDYLSALQKLVKTQLQEKKDNKEFDKLLKDIEKKLQRIQKEFEKESKELQKKYKGEADKIQKEIEKLEKRMEQSKNGKSELLPDSSFKKYENGWGKYFQKSKEPFDKYYRFFKEYRYFRKELEKRILEDLKQRGFIQE